MSRRAKDPVDSAMEFWRCLTDEQRAVFDGRVKEYRLAHGAQPAPAPRKPRKQKEVVCDPRS